MPQGKRADSRAAQLGADKHQQANARLHRQGQKYPVTVYNLICAGTVDERASAALEGKKGVQQSLLDSLNYLIRKHCEQ